MKTPTEDQIRRRAYEIYMKHGEPGRDAENWLQAERELKQALEPETQAIHREPKSSRPRRDAKRVAVVSSGTNQEFEKGELLKAGQRNEH